MGDSLEVVVNVVETVRGSEWVEGTGLASRDDGEANWYIAVGRKPSQSTWWVQSLVVGDARTRREEEGVSGR